MENENKGSVLDDIKQLKGYILTVIGFAVTVSAFLIKVVNVNEQVVLMTTCGIAVMMLVLGVLIQRSEQRQKAALEAHVVVSNSIVKEMRDNMLENQRSNLRTEMNLMIFTNPANHDTILKMAYRYFVELKGDWVETDEFLRWVESEEDAGRKVHIPTVLLNTVTTLQETEK